MLNRIAYEIAQRSNHSAFVEFHKNRGRDFIPSHLASTFQQIYFEIGSGTGHFFFDLSLQLSDVLFVAVERDRMRGNQLLRKSNQASHPNFLGYRGNIIPSFMHSIKPNSLDRIFILYPCPWPKNSHRKHRWYFHPVMKFLGQALKPGGLLIWASDQEFYIQEATAVSENYYPLSTLASGQLSQNPWNFLNLFPEGRTFFERSFLSRNLPCYELISRKTEAF